MTSSSLGPDDQLNGDGEYDIFLTLEDLESLLEELDEAGVEGDVASARLGDDLRERIKSAGISSTHALRARIARMHAQLDDEDLS